MSTWTLTIAPSASSLPWRAETRRLLRCRTSVWVLCLFAAVMLAGAAWSGLQARTIRDRIAGAVAAGEAALQSAQAKAAATHGSAFDPKRAVGDTYDYAAKHSPPAVLPPLEGLVLATRSFARLDAPQHVTLDSRHTDARRSEPIASPLLDRFGLPDLATLLVLILPLAAIGLGYGLVQEERERGTWRLLLAQPLSPLRWLLTALALRWMALGGVAVAIPTIAFALDPGAGAQAWLTWSLLVLLYAGFWMGMCGALCVLRISAAASGLAALGVWIATSFVLPAVLAWRVDHTRPMPSRLAAIAGIRDIQQAAETHMDELLLDWYRRHPDRHPAAPARHEWPVSFMPRYLEQERGLGPLMARFHTTRAARTEDYAQRAWLAPGTILLDAADRLAGSDAPRQARYAAAVDRFEAGWRAVFVPRIMSYRGMAASDFARLPRFRDALPATALDPQPWLMLAWAAILPLALLVVMRRRLSSPD